MEGEVMLILRLQLEMLDSLTKVMQQLQLLKEEQLSIQSKETLVLLWPSFLN
jgi:hypothetical protein